MPTLLRRFCCFGIKLSSSRAAEVPKDLLIEPPNSSRPDEVPGDLLIEPSSSQATEVAEVSALEDLLIESSSPQVSEIPEDLWFEILLRVPAESVTKFRGLSKFHRDLIDSSDFRRNHTRQSARKTCSHIILRATDYIWPHIDHQVVSLDLTEFGAKVHNLIDSSKEKGYSVVGCCLGILCLLYHPISGENHHILLRNPLTGDHRSIPVKYPTYFSYTYRYKLFLGHDATTDDLKILKVSHKDFVLNEAGDYECEIYSCRIGSWKTIASDDSNRPTFPWDYRGCFVRGTNSLHIAGKTSSRTIPAFDFCLEKFKRIPFPKELSMYQCRFLYPEVSDLDGCLCIGGFCCSGVTNGWTVWIMKEYGVEESWTRLYMLSGTMGGLLPMPLQYVKDGHDQMLLFSTKYKQNGVYVYDFKREKLINNLLTDQDSPIHFVYTPSLRRV